MHTLCTKFTGSPEQGPSMSYGSFHDSEEEATCESLPVEEAMFSSEKSGYTAVFQPSNNTLNNYSQ